MDEKVNLRLHNAMIEVAVCEFWEKKIAETDWSKDGDHEFSNRHTAKIKAVIKKLKAQARRRKLLSAAKRVAIVIMILCAVSFVTLMTSAAAREIVYKMATQIISIFRSENPETPLNGDEFQDYQTDKRIEGLEDAILDVLYTVGLPQDTDFQISIDGWLKEALI